MKKIGIISLFDFRNMNYGNKLQTYALNYYLRHHYPKYNVESLYFRNFLDSKDKNLCMLFISKILRIPAKINSIICIKFFLKDRLRICNDFAVKNIQICGQALTWNNLVNSDYDAFIVGSDIVWGQYRYGISKIKFLDFENKKKFKRIAYAASFGRDWIPKENINDIIRCLRKFQHIAVREESSKYMLGSIGITNVEHTLDPILLLDAEEWKSVEKEPKLNIGKYIFVYLLGKNNMDRKFITYFANKLHLTIVTVPYACGEFSFADYCFGDVRIKDCSPEEWIWLIDHAEYVITDSFHGIVFSTIFKKKFISLERQFAENINNRMIDYLKTIRQTDKMINIANIKFAEKFEWNYDVIDKCLEKKKHLSKKYLDNALKDI